MLDLRITCGGWCMATTKREQAGAHFPAPLSSPCSLPQLTVYNSGCGAVDASMLSDLLALESLALLRWHSVRLLGELALPSLTSM